MKPSVSELIPTNGYFPLRIHVIPQKILGASLLELSPQLVSNGRTQILSLSLFSPIKCTLSLHLAFAQFPGGSDGKASVYNVGDLASIPGLGSSLEKEMATHSSTLA